MRWIAIAAGVVAGLVVLVVGGIFGVSEAGGEIVTVVTRDADGAPHATRLWVVDHEGHAWLRSGVPTSAWFVRIQGDPRVEVTRGGATHSYRAEPVRDPETRDRVHALVAEKYGWADRVIGAMRDGSLSIPVRLVPLSEPASARPGS